MNKVISIVAILIVLSLSLMNANEVKVDEAKTKQAINTGYAIGWTGVGIIGLSNITGIVSTSLFIYCFAMAISSGIAGAMSAVISAPFVGGSNASEIGQSTAEGFADSSSLSAIFLTAVIFGWISVGLFVMGLCMTIAGFSYAAYYKKHRYSIKPILSGKELGISISF
jgi:hypothetical protein